MAATFAQVQGAIFNAQPIPYAAGQNLLKGEKSPYAIPCACDFGATGIPVAGYVIDPGRFYNSGALRTVQSIYFDNSQCNGTTQVYIPAFNQILSLPPFSCGYFPILAPQLSGGVMQVTSNAASGVANVLLLNTYFPAQTWSVIASSQGGSIPVADAILDGTVTADGAAVSAAKQNVRTKVAPLTAVDRSGTIAVANTSQSLAVANLQRQGLELQNMDTGNLEGLWYNPTGGAAVVGGVGSFELAQASAIGYPGGFVKLVTGNAVSIIAATAGHKFSCIEY